MTIDKTIEFFNGLEANTPQAIDARDVAIATMKKYQKIQEIVTKYGLEHEDAKATGQWIDILDRLPEGKPFDCFLVCYENGAVVTEQLWCICDFDYNEHIVAWMPLPKPYER